VVEKRLPNDLAVTLKTLEPYRADITGIAVESTFNWYWIVDEMCPAQKCAVRFKNRYFARQRSIANGTFFCLPSFIAP
jgi:hypothetical protein